MLLWVALVAVPCLLAFFVWAWRRKQAAMALFIPTRLFETLLIGYSARREKVRYALLGAAVLCGLLALAQPRWGYTWEEVKQRGLDVVAVSTAHGHSRGVGETVRLVREAFPRLPIIAGNVTSGAGVDFLAEAGANIIKVGQGPGSICTTRIVAGVGIPQFTALYVASRAARRRGVTVLADGGISKSGDIVKALTLAQGVVCGGLFAGCPEAPGQIIEINGKLYKQYRGMGSMAAMKAGSAARYGHSVSDTARKATVNYAMSNSFGFGGTNAVLLLKKYHGKQ